MPQPLRRRATTFVLLLLASGGSAALYTDSTAGERLTPPSSARRTAVGLRNPTQAAPVHPMHPTTDAVPTTAEPAAAERIDVARPALEGADVEQADVERAVVETTVASEPSSRRNPIRAADPSVSQAAAREQFNRTAYRPQARTAAGTTAAAPRRLAAAAGAQAGPVAPQPRRVPDPPAGGDELPAIQPAVEPTVVALQPAPQPPRPSDVRSSEPQIMPSVVAGEPVPVPKGGDDKPLKFKPPTLTPIGAVTTSIAPPAVGDLPDDYAALAQAGPSQDLAPRGELPRTSAPFYSTPRVADFTHRPLYFEEKALERNGRTIGVLQPVASFVHFYGTLPILPYKMGAQPPSRPMYTGNGINLPSDHLTVGDRVRGVMAEAGVVLGLNYALP